METLVSSPGLQLCCCCSTPCYITVSCSVVTLRPSPESRQHSSCGPHHHMRSAGTYSIASSMLSRQCVTSKLCQLHTRLACSAQPFSSAPTAEAATAPLQSSQRSQPHSSYIHPSLQPPLFQERINSDGSLTTGPQLEQQWRQQQQQTQQPDTSPHQQPQQQHQQAQQHAQQQQQQAPRVPGVPVAAPAAAPISQQQLEALVDLISGAQRVVVVTGAGCSTESNIPDYRGPRGAYTTGFTPMTHQQFMSKPEARRRYWARSYAGWHEFAGVGTNPAHEGLSRLQQRGWCDMVLTQNVDRLHHKAGSERVLELHGTTHRVICMDCGDSSCRHELQERLSTLNPAFAERVAALSSSGISSKGAWQRALRAGTAADARKVVQEAREASEQVPLRRPDGDVELVDAGVGFQLADCKACGSEMLKPDVVFFGDSVPKDRVESALSSMRACDLVLVVGSSLMVWSAFRLIKTAKEAGAALAIVNVGQTRADNLADLKVEALAGEVCMRLASHPRLLLPRVG